jgi:hypothetical protein
VASENLRVRIQPSVSLPTVDYFAFWNMPETVVTNTMRKGTGPEGAHPQVLVSAYPYDPEGIYGEFGETFTLSVFAYLYLECIWGSSRSA